MAAFYTHYKFGKDVINKSKLENIDMNLYTVFNQSFDNFYFYNFYLPFYGKKIRNIAKIGHRKNVNKYFEKIIKYIKKNKLENDTKVRAYLYGSINHYILDSIIHPYVFYQTGVYKKNNPKTYKYNGLHGDLEFSLDAYLYKKEFNKYYYKEKITNKVFVNPVFNNNLNNCIDNTFKDIFDVENGSNIYKKAIKDYRLAYKYSYTDTFGIKKVLLHILDFITGKKIVNLKSHTTHYTKFNESYLNKNNNIWYHPATKEKQTDSLFNLYDKAVLKSTYIVKELEKYFKNKSSIDNVLSLIGNNSYVTGLDINRNKKMKYFKF